MIRFELVRKLSKLGFYFIFLLLASELVLRLIGFKPIEIIPSDHKSNPNGVFSPDDSLGLKLQPGKYRVSLRDEIFYNVTHDSSGNRTTGKLINSDTVPVIQIYGCSYAYGWGVDDEKTLSYRLNEKLKENVISKAVPSHGTVQPLIILRRLKRKKNLPSKTIYCYNDFHTSRNIIDRYWRQVMFLGLLSSKLDDYDTETINNWAYVGAEMENGNIHLTTKKVKDFYRMFPLRDHSALVNILESIYINVEVQRLTSKAFDVTTQMLVEMNDICHSNGGEFILAIMSCGDSTKQIVEFCKNNGIETVDICPEGQFSDHSQYVVASWDSHPNEFGHEYFADAIYTYLTGDGFE